MKNFLKKFLMPVILVPIFMASVSYAYIYNPTAGGGGGSGNVVAGQPVTGCANKAFIYTTNAGLVGCDADAIRNSVTHDTTIAVDDGTYTQKVLVGDTGGGINAAGITRSINNPLSSLSGAWAVVDGAGFGRPDPIATIGAWTDATGNINDFQFMDSLGINASYSNTTSNSYSDLGPTGTDIGFTNSPGANTFDRKFFIDGTNIGWKDSTVGYTFNLPKVIGAAGSVLTDVAGNGTLSFQPAASSGVTSLNTLTGAVTLSAGSNITLTPSGNNIAIASTGGTGNIVAGQAVTGCAAKEFIYATNGSLVGCDTQAIRDSTTHETSILSSGITTGYTSGFDMTAGAGGSVNLTHQNVGTGVGSSLALKPLEGTLLVQDTPNQLAGGFDVNLNTGMAGFDYLNGAANRGVEIGALDGQAAFLKYTYNLGSNLGNVFGASPTGLIFNSDLVATNSNYLSLLPTAGTFSYGDLSNANKSTKAILSDNNQTFTGTTNVAGTQNLWNVGLPANAIYTSWGYQAGNPSITGTGNSMFGATSGVGLSTGLRNSFFGDASGMVVGTSNDNSYFGNGAGSGTVRTTNARNTAVGRLAGSNIGNGDSDNSYLGYNTLTTPGVSSSIVLGSGAASNASNQVIVGGPSAFVNDLVFGKGIASATPTNVNWRLTDGVGTNVQSGQWQFSSGDSTGNKGGGAEVFFVAPSGGSSGTSVNSALSNEVIRFNPDDVFLSKRLLSNVISIASVNQLVAGNSNQSSITGNTQINEIDARWIGAQGISFIFQGSPLLKNGGGTGGQFRSMLLKGGVDYTPPAGTTMTFYYDPVADAFREASRTEPSSSGITTGGTYTPTATNVTNITASTPNNTTYTRVGNIVTESGTITVTNTLAVASEVDISLGVASNLGATTDLNGTATMDSTASVNMYIKGDVTNDRAQIFFTSAGVGQTSTIYYSLQYSVI